MRIRFKAIVAIAAVAVCIGLVGTARGASEIVISYSTPPAWANWGGVLAAFSQESGIRAPSDLKTSGTAMAALMAEKDKPQADVVYLGISFAVEAARRGLLEPYKPKNFEKVPAALRDPGGAWFGIHMGAISLNVNRDALGNKGVPSSWADLLRPEYKGMSTIQSPVATFSGYMAFVAANLALGGTVENWEPGLAYFKKLKTNGLRIERISSYGKLLKGETVIHIDFDGNGYRARHKDSGNVDVIIPEEGSVYLPYVMALVKGAPRPANGMKFLDFLLSEKGQRLWAEGFVRPVLSGTMTAEQKAKFLPEAAYARVKSPDYVKIADVMPKFQERWRTEIGD